MSQVQQSKIFTWLKWYHDRGIIYLPSQEITESVDLVENKVMWFIYECEDISQSSAILEMLENIAKALKLDCRIKFYAIDQAPDLIANSTELPESLLLFGSKALKGLSKFNDSNTAERLCSFFILKPWNIPTIFLDSPAAMLKNPKLKAPAWKALQGFMKFLESKK